ncbi:DUF2244 domain-containing protein [Aquisalimonas lutea]|uniref:DUF2244 domain-containing protein n=1 Tax=Aquisalimonas lutea TaxID=1327750 RepID=UPI0025B5F1DC|nr:DUF2244 domain-containing protein [Aquisalimonas lutea]MDN3516199.1 DUF2244 domain-containing protein [Aquisalimonas lutea]
MAMTRTETAADTRLFDLRPNAGVYWQQTLVIFLMFSAVCLGVAIAFTVAGFWPILPFAGLEVVALGAALYVSARRGDYREVIRVGPDRVRVEKGRRQPEQTWEFRRAWSAVELQRSPVQWYPARLVIRSGADQVECGAFLNDEERESLAAELTGCIGPMAGGDGRPPRSAAPRGE